MANDAIEADDFRSGQWYSSLRQSNVRLLLPNLVTFAASLHRHGLYDFSTWAIANLQDALENDHEKQPEILDAYVSSTAQWILQDGKDIQRSESR